MSKQELVKELSAAAYTTRRQTEALLESLADIACREASAGLILPGFCKFELVERKARQGRNPRTGELMHIPGGRVLKIRALGQAKEKALSYNKNTGQEEETKVVGPDAAVNLYVIACPLCGEELEAEPDMAGEKAECPVCDGDFEIPQPEDNDRREI